MTLAEVKRKYTRIRHLKGTPYYVRFIVRNQEFTVARVEKSSEAQWWRDSLAHALYVMIEENRK